MAIITDICKILSGYSEKEPLNYAELYKILRIDFKYSDEQIDEALEYMFNNKMLSKRGTDLAYVIWLS